MLAIILYFIGQKMCSITDCCFPLHLRALWCLATVELSSHQISYYDPLKSKNPTCLHTLWEYLVCMYRKLNSSDYAWSVYVYVCLVFSYKESSKIHSRLYHKRQKFGVTKVYSQTFWRIKVWQIYHEVNKTSCGLSKLADENLTNFINSPNPPNFSHSKLLSFTVCQISDIRWLEKRSQLSNT